MLNTLIKMAENGNLPDFMVEIGIKSLCNQRLKWRDSLSLGQLQEHHQDWVDKLKDSPIALVPEKANEQHYELPPEFFEIVLGQHLKYSSGYWNNGIIDIDKSEQDMLQFYLKRAQIKENMNILELGCGWGSLTIFMAKNFPNCTITAVSNSNDQRKFIENKCKNENIDNIKIITCDMNDFTIEEKFDRVVSIEMFEHMRNYQKLLSRISHFLNDNGKLFVHIFTHKTLVYPYEDNGPGDWMAREFFSGGLMPSHNLLLNFQDHLKIEKQWHVSGEHYQKTSYAWLKRMDKNKTKILTIFRNTYGKENAKMWFYRWRIFFMSCAVMFGIKNGTEWGVSHYRFKK